MKIINGQIEEYCLNKSSKPSAVLRELEKFTKENVDYSQMLIGELVASFLATLVSINNSKRVLEVGCFTGYSALSLAEALPEEGEVTTLDINEETNKIALEFWGKSAAGTKIKSILGDARETMKNLKPGFDMIFIDADKGGYIEYLRLGLDLLSKKGFIVADNCLWSGEVLNAKSKDEATQALRSFNEYVSGRSDLHKTLVPIRDGLFIIHKI